MTHDNFEEELRELVASGKKIQAIKLYREKTGAGLAEAKEAVEAFATGGDLPSAGDDLQDRIPVDDPELVADVTSLLQEGKALDAIKLVRVRAGVKLNEAKEIVDRIGEDAGLLAQSGSGCMGMILLGIAGPVVLGHWMLFA